MQWLWLFLPDEALVLIIALIGLGLMVGILRPRLAGSLIGGIVLMLLLSPFIESLLSSLPSWVGILLLVAIGWSVIRGLFGSVFGRGATDHMLGSLAADIVRATFRGTLFLLTLPFRFIGWMLRRA